MKLQDEALLWMHAAALDGLRVILTRDEARDGDALAMSAAPDEYRQSRYPELAGITALASASAIDNAALALGKMIFAQIENSNQWEAFPHLDHFYDLARRSWSGG